MEKNCLTITENFPLDCPLLPGNTFCISEEMKRTLSRATTYGMATDSLDQRLSADVKGAVIYSSTESTECVLLSRGQVGGGIFSPSRSFSLTKGGRGRSVGRESRDQPCCFEARMKLGISTFTSCGLWNFTAQ